MKIIIIKIILILSTIHLYADAVPHMPPITDYFLKSLERTEQEKKLHLPPPKEMIFLRNGFIEASGKDKASTMNNEALAYVFMQENDRAVNIFEEITQKSRHFFPAYFNKGLIYLQKKDHQKAKSSFMMARRLFPQYWKNYYYLAKSYELEGLYDEAIYHFRIAYLKNPYDLSSLTSLGDLLVSLQRLREAEKIYRYALRQDNGFNFALNGMGKVAFYRGKYYTAIYWFKNIDFRLDYPKEVHFYYGESLFNVLDYPEAAEQFEKMLAYPQNIIYEKISLSRMRFRLKQTKRLALQEESKK